MIYQNILAYKFNILFSLTQKHDGAYLAQVVADCLKRFGLDEMVLLSYLYFDII